jgi:hypothetical protein
LLTSPPAVAKHARLAFVVCDLLCAAYSDTTIPKTRIFAC